MKETPTSFLFVNSEFLGAFDGEKIIEKMKVQKLLWLISLAALLTLNFASCKDDNEDVKQDPQPEQVKDGVSCNEMSDFLKSQNGESTVTVSITDENPDFAKMRSALTANPNVKVKLDLSKCTGLKEIPENAFYNSTLKKEGGATGIKNLVAIILPETITKIGNNAFRDCILLAEINLPEKTEDIGSYVFANCESLTLIVIPKSVLKIGENVFDGCTKITITNNSNVDLNGSNPPDEEITILPNKITKIVGHWTEDGEHDNGGTSYFIYDEEGRIQTINRDTYYTYTDNSIKRGDNNFFTLKDGKIISHKEIDDRERIYNFVYTDGYITEVTRDNYTQKYTYNNGLITTCEDNEGSKCTYEYNNVKNNLNIDIFAMIDVYGYTDECLSQFFGKRNKYLPSKITEVCNDEYDKGTYEYYFAYEFSGDYITKIEIQCGKDGKRIYIEGYEIYYGDVEIPPAQEDVENQTSQEIQPSLSNLKVTAQANGQISIDAKITANSKIKLLALTKNSNPSLSNNDIISDLLLVNRDIKEAGENYEKFTLPIQSHAVDVQEMYLYVETEGGKKCVLSITENISFQIGAAKATIGSFFSVKDLKTYLLSEAKEISVDIIAISSEDKCSVIGFKKATQAPNTDVAAKAGKVAFFQNGTSIEEVLEGGVIMTESSVICLISKITNNQDAIAYVEGYMIKKGMADVESVDISAVSSYLSK